MISLQKTYIHCHTLKHGFAPFDVCSMSRLDNVPSQSENQSGRARSGSNNETMLDWIFFKDIEWDQEVTEDSGTLSPDKNAIRKFTNKSKSACTHLDKVNLQSCCGVTSLILDQACGRCNRLNNDYSQSNWHNWMCLTCCEVYCGRTAKAHMMHHVHNTGHPIVIALDDLSIWCYGCNMYITPSKGMDSYKLQPVVDHMLRIKQGGSLVANTGLPLLADATDAPCLRNIPTIRSDSFSKELEDAPRPSALLQGLSYILDEKKK